MIEFFPQVPFWPTFHTNWPLAGSGSWGLILPRGDFRDPIWAYHTFNAYQHRSVLSNTYKNRNIQTYTFQYLQYISLLINTYQNRPVHTIHTNTYHISNTDQYRSIHTNTHHYIQIRITHKNAFQYRSVLSNTYTYRQIQTNTYQYV